MVSHLNPYISTFTGAAAISIAEPFPRCSANGLLFASRFIRESIGLGYLSFYSSQIKNYPLMGALAGASMSLTTQSMKYFAQTSGEPIPPEMAKSLGKHLYKPKLIHLDTVARSTFRYGALFTFSPYLDGKMKERSISPTVSHMVAGSIGGISSEILVVTSNAIDQACQGGVSLGNSLKNNYRSIIPRMPKAVIFGYVAYNQVIR